MCEKCLVLIEESVLLQVVCTGPLRLFFFRCGKVGGCLGGGRRYMFQEGSGFVCGFRGGGVI